MKVQKSRNSLLHGGTSNEYPQHIFMEKLKKIIATIITKYIRPLVMDNYHEILVRNKWSDGTNKSNGFTMLQR